MPRSRLFLLLPVLISLALYAQLGPETPVSGDASPEILPAAFAQSSPIIASNGRGFLAAWVDRRNGASALYAVRLDGSGRPVTPYAQRIALDVRTAPVITLDALGRGYVIAWYSGGAPTLAHVDEDGRLIERIAPPPNAEFSNGEWKSLPVLRSISTNGSTHAVWAEQYYYGYFGKIGFVRSAGGESATMTATSGVMLPGTIEANGSSFTTFGFAAGLVRTTVDEQGVTLASLDRRGNVPDAQWFRPRMALAPDRLLIAGFLPGEDSNTPGRLTYMLLDRDGNVLHPMTTIPVPVNSSVTNVFWDGVEFLVTLTEYPATLSAMRISADGAPLAPKPILLSTTGEGPVAVASDGATRVLLWRDTRFSNRGDIVSRAVPNFASLANASEVQLVSYSARAQANVGVATAGQGQHRMFVWDDGQEIGGRLDERELRIGGSPASAVLTPTIAASDGAFLVAWIEVRTDGTSRLMARRYATDGTPLDPQPQVLVSDLVYASGLGVGSDGSSFLVVCSSRIDEIVLVRVDVAGTSAVVRHHTPLNYGWNFIPLWLGSHWLVPYLGGGTGIFQTLDVAPDLESVRDVDVPSYGYANSLSAALGGENRIAYAWLSGTAVRFAETSLNGTPLFGPIDVASGYQLKPALAWTGSRYLLAWTDQYGTGPNRVNAIRLTVDGVVLDPTPIEIASANVIAVAPSIARAGSGAIIAYSRDDESQTGVVRAFFRTHGVADIPRRPAVRH